VSDGIAMGSGGEVSGGEGAGIPEVGGEVIARDTGAGLVEHAKIRFGGRKALGGGEADPMSGDGRVFRNSEAAEIENTKIVLRDGIALLGGGEKPPRSFR